MMVEQGQRLMPAQIHRAFNLLLKCAEEVSRSPFPKLVLEMGLLQVCAQGPTLPVSEALNALAALEKNSLRVKLAPDHLQLSKLR